MFVRAAGTPKGMSPIPVLSNLPISIHKGKHYGRKETIIVRGVRDTEKGYQIFFLGPTTNVWQSGCRGSLFQFCPRILDNFWVWETSMSCRATEKISVTTMTVEKIETIHLLRTNETSKKFVEDSNACFVLSLNWSPDPKNHLRNY